MNRKILRAIEVADFISCREFNLSVHITVLLPSANYDFVFQFTSKRTLRNFVSIVITLYSSVPSLFDGGYLTGFKIPFVVGL